MAILAALPGWMLGAGGGVAALTGSALIWAKFLLPWLADRADKRQQTRTDGNREWEAKLKEREAEQEQRDREFAERLQAGLAACEEHCEAMRRDFDTLREDHRVVVLVIRIAVPKLRADAPDSAELALIRRLLASRFPVDPSTPDDMTALLALLDAKT